MSREILKKCLERLQKEDITREDIAYVCGMLEVLSSGVSAEVRNEAFMVERKEKEPVEKTVMVNGEKKIITPEIAGQIMKKANSVIPPAMKDLFNKPPGLQE